MQAIIVVPSRELAMQIVRVAQSLLPEDARGAVQQCIGGANPHRQVSARECGSWDMSVMIVAVVKHCLACLAVRRRQFRLPLSAVQRDGIWWAKGRGLERGI